MGTFQVGDVCVTQNGEVFGLLNDGSTVVILAIDRSRRDCYRIKKIDGQPFAAGLGDGVPMIRDFSDLWACPHHLRRPDLRHGWSDSEAIEQLSIQRQLEAVAFGRR